MTNKEKLIEHCCGKYPNIEFLQLGFKDEINRVIIKCKKCFNKICENNDGVSDEYIKTLAIEKWNLLIRSKINDKQR